MSEAGGGGGGLSFDQLVLMNGGRMGGRGGAGAGGGSVMEEMFHRLFGGLIPNLNGMQPILSFENNAMLGFLNKTFPIINLNPSNPNGLLAKIMRAFGFDRFIKEQNIAQMAKTEQHQAQPMSYGHDAVRPMATPAVAGHGGHGAELG